MSYDVCEYTCYRKGMDVLIIETQSAYLNLRDYLNSNNPHSDRWLNGRKFSNKWYVYRNNEKTDHPMIIPFKNSTDNCYALTKNDENIFEGTGSDCSKKNICICEFANIIYFE
jgi:hypothetical protein